MKVKKQWAELITSNPSDRIALRGVHVHARLSGMSQKTTVEQTFVNLEPRAIEAVYTFPLPDGAAVCGFEVFTADRVLTGMIEEADRATEKYEDAISEGHGAFTVEQDRPDVFTVRVGNLKPQQAATIRLKYVCPLERVDRAIRVTFPTTIAPRYASGTATDPVDAAMDADALNPPHVLFVPYGLSLDVDIALGRELKEVTSPSHAITVSQAKGEKARVTLRGGLTEMDREIVLLLGLQNDPEPQVQVAPGKNGESYLAVTFVPEFDVDELLEPAPSETVFVLDCSGSMQGASIEQAMTALELCMRSLSTGDTFNICRFGSSWDLMSSEPLHYSQATLDAAVSFVRSSHDMGGTELYKPLQAILTTQPAVGSVRQVILLTDGQVTNEPAVLELARCHRSKNRIFSFGIGPACSTHLVRGLARATDGAAEFITAGERIDEKVLRTFSRMASPSITNVRLEWDGCDVQTLAQIPPVFDGDVLSVFGSALGRVPEKVTLSCQTASGPKTWTVRVPAPEPDDDVIATMWARRTIQSLEEVNGISRSARKTSSPERETLIRISRESGLLCSLTTIIAIEHRSEAERNEGRPALRRVPVMLARGWGGILTAGAAAGGGAMFRAKLARGTLYDSDIEEEKSGEGLLDLSREADPQDVGDVPYASIAAAPVPSQPFGFARSRNSVTARVAAGDSLILLLAQQAADGSFSQGQIVQRLLAELKQSGIDLRQIIESKLPRQIPPGDHSTAVVTAIAVLLLMLNFPQSERSWRRAYRKACSKYLAPRFKMPLDTLEGWIREVWAEAKK